MKRTTIKGLQAYADEENRNNQQIGLELDWFDILYQRLENGNISEVKQDIQSMSKKETLEVIDISVSRRGDCGYDDSLLRKIYFYAYYSLHDKLSTKKKR